MCMIFALVDVSGANLDPAVTLAILFLNKGKEAAAAGAYIGTQIVGCVAE